MSKLNQAVLFTSLICCQASIIAQDVVDENKPSVSTNVAGHIVRAGDSLFSIARQYKISVEQIKEWNNITDENKISVGQLISLTPDEGKRSISLKEKAQKAFSVKDYALAVKLFTQLYQQGNVAEKQLALEFLGVSREKKGQKAFAKQAYKTFLKYYPDAEAAKRIQLRLDNLIGIETLAKDRSLKKSKNRKKLASSYLRGSVSSDYRNSIVVNDIGESNNTLSLANVDVNAKGLLDQKGYDIGFNVSVGHYQDLLSYPDNRTDKTNQQIRYLSASAKSDDNLYQMTIGRQRSRGKGIFGRFDGVLLSSEVYEDVQVNFVAGYPVASSKVTSLDTERQFYGLSVDVDNTWQDIDFSVFLFEQSINGLTDRRAIGGELSYFHGSTSMYSLVDYDIFFNELNALLFSGSYTTDTFKRFSWSMNYRKSPYVGTRNALIGQSVDSFAELQDLFLTDEEILDLALDRTLTSQTLSFQYSQPINKTFDISSSLTYMDLSGAPESGGVPEISESGAQFYANIFLSGKKLFSNSDTNSLGFRYSSLATSDVMSLYATSQYRFSNGLSLTPKLRFDSRSNDNGTNQQSISPTLRVQYQSKKHYLYTDLGAIFYNTESLLTSSQRTDIYFLYLGYRYYF